MINGFKNVEYLDYKFKILSAFPKRVFGIYAGHNRLRHMVELAISNHA